LVNAAATTPPAMVLVSAPPLADGQQTAASRLPSRSTVPPLTVALPVIGVAAESEAAGGLEEIVADAPPKSMAALIHEERIDEARAG